MHTYKKADFPLAQIRRFLEPGPIVLVSCAHKGERNVMALGWHTVMEFSPSLVGCVIASGNHSFDLIRLSRQCVINLPTLELAKTVADIGNCSGAKVDKFEKFKLTAQPARQVSAPLIAQCYANFECRLHDAKLIKSYNFFIFEVVEAHVASAPKHPRTIHYRGDGGFMVAGGTLNLRRRFRPQML